MVMVISSQIIQAPNNGPRKLISSLAYHWYVGFGFAFRAVADQQTLAGTSSGFGRRLVFSVLARGDKVIATARSQDKLTQLVDSCDESLRRNLKTIALDVTEGRKSLEIKMRRAAGYWGHIDVLVNNAGKPI